MITWRLETLKKQIKKKIHVPSNRKCSMSKKRVYWRCIRNLKPRFLFVIFPIFAAFYLTSTHFHGAAMRMARQPLLPAMYQGVPSSKLRGTTLTKSLPGWAEHFNAPLTTLYDNNNLGSSLCSCGYIYLWGSCIIISLFPILKSCTELELQFLA